MECFVGPDAGESRAGGVPVSAEERRLVSASWETFDHRRLVTRGDALAILGKSHPARAAVDALPCEGNHKVGYCAGVVVDVAEVLAAIEGVSR